MKAERGSSMVATRSIGSINNAPRGISRASGREFSARAFSRGITRIPGTERRISTSPTRLIPKSGKDFLNLPRFNPGLPKPVNEGVVGKINLKNTTEFAPILPSEAIKHNRHDHHRRTRPEHRIQNHGALRHEPARKMEIRRNRENIPSISKPGKFSPIHGESPKHTDSQNALKTLENLNVKRTELRRKSPELGQTPGIQKSDSKFLRMNPDVVRLEKIVAKARSDVRTKKLQSSPVISTIENLAKPKTITSQVLPEMQLRPRTVLNPTQKKLAIITRTQMMQVEQPVLQNTEQKNAQRVEASSTPASKTEISTPIEIFSAKKVNQKILTKPIENVTDEKREYESDPKANEGRRKLLKKLFRKLKKERSTAGKLPTGAEITRYVPSTPDDSVISEIVKGTKKDGSWSALVAAIGKMKSFSEVTIDSLIKSLTAVRKRPKVIDPVGHDAVRLVLSGNNANGDK